jgi:hypothetical protein
VVLPEVSESSHLDDMTPNFNSSRKSVIFLRLEAVLSERLFFQAEETGNFSKREHSTFIINLLIYQYGNRSNLIHFLKHVNAEIAYLGPDQIAGGIRNCEIHVTFDRVDAHPFH